MCKEPEIVSNLPTPSRTLVGHGCDLKSGGSHIAFCGRSQSQGYNAPEYSERSQSQGYNAPEYSERSQSQGYNAPEYSERSQSQGYNAPEYSGRSQSRRCTSDNRYMTRFVGENKRESAKHPSFKDDARA